MKRLFLLLVTLLILSFAVSATVTTEELNQAKIIINSKISCNELSNDQLKLLGEYLMEQMHPGESHELMDKMMGLEENPNEDAQFHINLAKTMYCNEYGSMLGNKGMMNMMARQGYYGNTIGPGMMNYSYGWSIWDILYFILLIALILLVILLIFKLYRNLTKPSKRK